MTSSASSRALIVYIYGLPLNAIKHYNHSIVFGGLTRPCFSGANLWTYVVQHTYTRCTRARYWKCCKRHRIISPCLRNITSWCTWSGAISITTELSGCDMSSRENTPGPEATKFPSQSKSSERDVEPLQRTCQEILHARRQDGEPGDGKQNCTPALNTHPGYHYLVGKGDEGHVVVHSNAVAITAEASVFRAFPFVSQYAQQFAILRGWG